MRRMMPISQDVAQHLRFLALASLCWLASCTSTPKVGFLGTLSGSASELGASGRDGVQLAMESEGISLEVCDDHAQEDSAAGCMERFDSMGIRVVVGPMTSNVAKRVAEEAIRRRMLVVSPTVSHSGLSGKDDYFVKLMPENIWQSELLATHMVERRSKSVSILFASTNAAYAEPIAMGIRDALADTGVQVEFLEGYVSGPNLDFTPWISRMKDSSAVVVIGSSMDLGVFQKDNERAGKTLHVHSAQWGMGDDLLRVAGPAAEGMILTGMPEQVARTPEIDALRAKFQARFARSPTFGAVFGWEAAQIAIKLHSGSGTKEALRAVLRDTAFAPLGWRLGLDSLGDPIRLPILCQVRQGRFEKMP